MCFNKEIAAFAASWPLFIFLELLSIACVRVKEVIIPLVTGTLCSMERSSKDFVIADAIKSKWGVLPFIIQPKAMKNLYFFFILQEIKVGISNAQIQS